MVLDIELFRADKGGNPDKIKENQAKRFKDVTLVDKVVTHDTQWRKSKLMGRSANCPLSIRNTKKDNLSKSPMLMIKTICLCKACFNVCVWERKCAYYIVDDAMFGWCNHSAIYWFEDFCIYFGGVDILYVLFDLNRHSCKQFNCNSCW